MVKASVGVDAPAGAASVLDDVPSRSALIGEKTTPYTTFRRVRESRSGGRIRARFACCEVARTRVPCTTHYLIKTTVTLRPKVFASATLAGQDAEVRLGRGPALWAELSPSHWLFPRAQLAGFSAGARSQQHHSQQLIGAENWPHALRHASITTGVDQVNGDVRQARQL